MGRSYVVSMIIPAAYFATLTTANNTVNSIGNLSIIGTPSTLTINNAVINYSGGYTNVSVTSANTVIQSFILIGNTTNAGNIERIISTVNPYY